MKKLEYLKPTTLEEVFSLLEEHGEKAKLIAGGTDVVIMIKKKQLAPDYVISLNNVAGLDNIAETNGVLRIGSMVRHRALENSPLIREKYTALYDATSVLGSVQIRNIATIGGNICTSAPSADTAPPLLALDAQVVIKGGSGERVVPLTNFYLGAGKNVLAPGEVVTEFEAPKALLSAASAYYKLSRRAALDLPIIGVAVYLRLSKDHSCCEDARIALGVCAPIPIRALEAETLLKGSPADNETFERAGEAAAREAKPRDSVRGAEWYRRDMVRVLVPRMARRCVERIKSQCKE